jgi:hypothetical protein
MNREGELWLIDRTKESEVSKKESRAREKSIAKAIVVLLRGGCSTQDLSSLYLAGADFHDLNLSGVKFDKATLVQANFKGSVLNDASFNNADLREVGFAKAKLRNAKLTAIEPDDYSLPSAMGRDIYNLPKDSKDQSVVAPLPDFSDADLTNADFTGFPILPIVCSDSKIHLSVVQSFEGANLSGADFSQASLFGLEDRCSTEPLQLLFVEGIDDKRGAFIAAMPKEPTPGSEKNQPQSMPAKWANWAVRFLFEGADTSVAKFDERFRSWAKFGE